jgi:hypothetical protein
MPEIHLSELSTRIKPGDCLLFWHANPLYVFSRIIAWGSGYNHDHIGIVTKVDKHANSVEFMFSEMTASIFSDCAKHTPYIITNLNGNWVFNGRDLEINGYLEVKKPLDKDSENELYRYAEMCYKNKKRYGWVWLIFCQINVYPRLPQCVKRYLEKHFYHNATVCSTHVQIACFHAGIKQYIIEQDNCVAPGDFPRNPEFTYYEITQ